MSLGHRWPVSWQNCPVSFSIKNNRTSLGHRPVDPCLSRQVSQGHPAVVYVPFSLLKNLWKMDFSEKTPFPKDPFFRTHWNDAASSCMFLLSKGPTVNKSVSKSPMPLRGNFGPNPVSKDPAALNYNGIVSYYDRSTILFEIITF